MPLSVEVKINGQLIETVHIGRTEPLAGYDVEHQYKVTTEAVPVDGYAIPDWEAGVRFGHVYSDGALVCVRRALEALENHERTQVPNLR